MGHFLGIAGHQGSPLKPVRLWLASHPWGYALGWLAFLAPFFFISYGFANQHASQLAAVPSYVYDWEHHIPFVPWTILPYWSEDLLYGLSILLCINRQEVKTQALRLFTASAVSVSAFLAYPLRFSFDKPQTHGLWGALFDTLAGFDKPFNQAPSLHISLLIIIWVRLNQHCPRLLKPLLHGWCLLIGISVLTTYQHHFIDVWTGALVGLACLYIWPDAPQRWQWHYQGHRAANRKLAVRYALAALAFTIPAFFLQAFAWLLLWPATSLLLVSLAYLGLGTSIFQKQQQHSLAARIILAPYLLGAWLSMRYFARRLDAKHQCHPNLWVGHWAADHAGPRLDLCAELPGRPNTGKAQPMLDLVPPNPAEIEHALAKLDQLLAEQQPVLVHCALGLSRSTVLIAAWLLRHGHVHSAEQAMAHMRNSRPGTVLTADHLLLLKRFERTGNAAANA